MSAAPVLGYVIGIGVFAAGAWFLDGIKEILVDNVVYQHNVVFSFFQYVWTGAFIIFIIGGGIYLIRRYSERQYMGGI